MKNILVPTDFSANAKAAALYAAGLARQINGRIILSHNYHSITLLEDEEGGPEGNDLETDAQEKMDLLAWELHSGFGVSVTRLLRPGFAADEIIFLAQKVKAALVVMGMQGATLKPDAWLGKITAEILQKADFPVLCVPPTALFEEFSCIACFQGNDEAFLSVPGLNLFQDLGVKQVALPLITAGEQWQVSVPVAHNPTPELARQALADEPNVTPEKDAFGEEEENPEEKVPQTQPQLFVIPLSYLLSLQGSLLSDHPLFRNKNPFLLFPGVASR